MRFARICHAVSLAGIAAALALQAGVAYGLITAVLPAANAPNAKPKAASVSRLLAADARSRAVTLAAPSPAEMGALIAANKASPRMVGASAGGNAGDKGRPLAIGFGRAVPLADRVVRGADLLWVPVADGGFVARIDVASHGAAALRLAVAMNDVHPDVTARFMGSAPGAEVFAVPGHSIAAATARDGAFWSPVLEGETATVEIFAPAGVERTKLIFTLLRVSHLAVAGNSLRQLSAKDAIDIGAAGACNIDIACAPASTALLDAAKSVAKMVFSEGNGDTFLCTGTLLNDSRMSLTPYFFTASHCIDSQYAATTLNTYWFFDAVSCGSLQVPPYVLLPGGAMLLARSQDYDWSLVRLKAPAPEGARFSAWRAEPVSTGTVGIAIHHAGGDLKKWTQGLALGSVDYADADVNGTFLSMQWSRGSTEAGSSGAGLFTLSSPGGYYELRGGLWGGTASCHNPQGYDLFSRLDNALPLVRQYLAPDAANPTALAPAIEFYHSGLDHYFISSNPAEIDDVDTGVHPGWVRTGFRFLAYSDPRVAPPDASPVCRFYLRPEVGNSHFYSADPNECAETARRFGASWIYESPSVFYIRLPDKASGACPRDTRAVYRFYNRLRTNHRYTAETTVRDLMAAAPLVWAPEGYGPGPHYPIMCAPPGV